MNFKALALLAVPAFSVLAVNGQELTNKIPAHAQFVLSVNNHAIVNHSSMELLNETLAKLTSSTQAEEDLISFMPAMLQDTGIDLNRNTYVYKTSNDSLSHVGVLLPLKSNHQVGNHMLSNFSSLPAADGYERAVSSDGQIHAAWNNDFLLILTGQVHTDYFNDADVANRYGIERTVDAASWYEDNDTSEYAAVADTVDTTWLATDDWEDTAIDSTSLDLSEVVHCDLPQIDPSAEVETSSSPTEDEDFSYLWNDEPDSTTIIYQAREAKNDSIKNDLLINWLAAEVDNSLKPEENLGHSKSINLSDNNHILRLWVPNPTELYREALPIDILQMAYGVNIEKINYGYKDFTLDLVQEKHTIKLLSTLNLDRDMGQIFSNIYSGKMNKKFKKYIPQDHIAYGSVNLSTEGYFSEIPKLLSRWYAPTLGDNGDFLNLAATAIEIGLDEKAIANVKRGDDIFVLNDLRKVQKDYITYEYDEDYDYQEVTKTKDVYIPSFLWMFTSTDHRIYKNLLDIAIRRNHATIDEDDIYTIEELDDLENLYVYFKNDIVFVGSDRGQMVDIKNNRFNGNKNALIKKDIYSNDINLSVRTSMLSDVLQKLEIPVTNTWEETVHELSNYGDIQLTSNMKGKNTVYGAVSLELPKTEKNALQYVLKKIIKNIDTSIEN